MNAHDCPNDSLHLILSDDCGHPEYASVVSHLDNCRHCRDRLDGLTADEQWWSETRVMLSESTEVAAVDLPDSNSLVVARLEASGGRDGSSIDEVRSFLDPPRHPEMLGRVGKYEVERVLGRGGMGIVLKGFDSELNRPVAIKLLAPHLASSGTARQRFVREARAAAAVVHDNVVAIHGIETAGDLPAIVMPLISGASLQQHIERHGALNPVDVVQIGMQVAAGLSAAHAQGLVHRDIKPGNILLENDLNRVQITDFGLARAAHDANLTHSGVIAGTPHFMSPEQALGERVDHRADLFSLGSVLYFMATGEVPFSATTPMGVMQRVCNTTPRPVRELNPAIPEQLESVIDKLLEKSPDNRFDSASRVYEYMSDYLAYLQQPTARKAPPRLMTVARRLRRRNALIRTVTGATAVAGLAILMWTLSQPDKTRGVARIRTFADLNVAPESQVDAEINEIARRVLALEASSGTGTRLAAADRDTGELEADISALETPRSAGWASNFDREVQSIDAALQWLEQTAPERAFFSPQ